MNQLFTYIKNSDKKFLIFDFDDTIIHLNINWGDYSELIHNKFLELDKELVETTNYSDPNDLINIMILKHGEKAKEISDKLSEEFEMNNMNGYKKNEELLDFISKDAEYTKYIWSNNTSKRIIDILEKENLVGYFHNVVTKDRVKLAKPYANGFNQIYNPQMHLKRDFLFIGNNEYSDGGAARNAGIEFYHVDWDF